MGDQEALTDRDFTALVKIPDLIIAAVAEHPRPSCTDKTSERIAAITRQPWRWVEVAPRQRIHDATFVLSRLAHHARHRGASMKSRECQPRKAGAASLSMRRAQDTLWKAADKLRGSLSASRT